MHKYSQDYLVLRKYAHIGRQATTTTTTNLLVLYLSMFNDDRLALIFQLFDINYNLP